MAIKRDGAEIIVSNPSEKRTVKLILLFPYFRLFFVAVNSNPFDGQRVLGQGHNSLPIFYPEKLEPFGRCEVYRSALLLCHFVFHKYRLANHHKSASEKRKKDQLFFIAKTLKKSEEIDFRLILVENPVKH